MTNLLFPTRGLRGDAEPGAAGRPAAPASVERPALRSFWIGGFEGADHVNMHGRPLDMVAITGHDAQLDADYARLVGRGLGAVRETVGWRLAEPQPGRRDFARLRRVADAARRHGVQVLWTLMHYGTPDGLKVTDDAFVPRFADFAAAVARELRRVTGAPSVYTPVNEIGFLAWAIAHSPLIGGQSRTDEHHPPVGGYAVKHRLVEAALAAVDAIAAEDPGARFLHIEPVIHVAAPHGRPDLHDAATAFSGYQWQAWDMLLGRLAPELGGSARAMHWVGVNHYHDAQWEFNGGALAWQPPDTRRRAFSELLKDTWRRYGLPIVVAETSHVGFYRAPWLDEIAAETQRAIAAGVAVEGLCLYPVIDRPDWNDLHHWHHSGLWDVIENASATDARIDPDFGPGGVPRHLDGPYADVLARWQQRLGRRPARG